MVVSIFGFVFLLGVNFSIKVLIKNSIKLGFFLYYLSELVVFVKEGFEFFFDMFRVKREVGFVFFFIFGVLLV